MIDTEILQVGDRVLYLNTRNEDNCPICEVIGFSGSKVVIHEKTWEMDKTVRRDKVKRILGKGGR